MKETYSLIDGWEWIGGWSNIGGGCQGIGSGSGDSPQEGAGI